MFPFLLTTICPKSSCLFWFLFDFTRRIKAAKEFVPAGLSAWGPQSAKHGVAKDYSVSDAKRPKLTKDADGKPPAKSHKKKPDTAQSSNPMSHTTFQSKHEMHTPLATKQSTSDRAGASHRETNAPVALVWASYDNGTQAEDANDTDRLPCPFSQCHTFHNGFDSLEHHLRKSKFHWFHCKIIYRNQFLVFLFCGTSAYMHWLVGCVCTYHRMYCSADHVLEKTCLCGRAFISDSSLVQHFKDSVVLDLVNSRSTKMFSCLPGNS
jgi:hypothetical protein